MSWAGTIQIYLTPGITNVLTPDITNVTKYVLEVTYISCISWIYLRTGFVNLKLYVLVFPYTVNLFDTQCHECHNVCIWVLWASTPGVTNGTVYIYSLHKLGVNNIGIYFPNEVCSACVLESSTRLSYSCLMTSFYSRTMTQDLCFLWDSNLTL